MHVAPPAETRGNKRLRPQRSGFDVLGFNLAGRGGEEEDEDGGDVVCVCGLLLPRRASSTVARFATGISGRDGPVPRLDGVLAASRWEAFFGLCSGLQRFFCAKWFVPGEIEAAGGKSPVAVEGSKDLTAFLPSLLGSSLLNRWSLLQIRVCKGPVCDLFPPFEY
jgi:hypothetical protein